MRSYLWIVFLVGCLAATFYYQIYDQNGWLFTIFSCLRVPAAIAGYLMYPRLRGLLVWLVLAAIAFALGDLLAYNYTLFFAVKEYPFPSIADIPYLAFYPLLGAGILWQLKRWGVDSRLKSLAPIALAIVLVVALWIEFSGISMSLGLLVGVLYPLGDLLLLYCMWRMREVVSCAASSFLLASTATLVVADVLYSWVTIHGTYQPPGALDWLWLVSYAMFGAATLHPSMLEAPRVTGRAACASV